MRLLVFKYLKQIKKYIFCDKIKRQVYVSISLRLTFDIRDGKTTTILASKLDAHQTNNFQR